MVPTVPNIYIYTVFIIGMYICLDALYFMHYIFIYIYMYIYTQIYIMIQAWTQCGVQYNVMSYITYDIERGDVNSLCFSFKIYTSIF